MRALLPAAIAALTAMPAFGQALGYEDSRESRSSVTFLYPSVRLDNGRYYPVHAGDGIDYCRQSGFRRARESGGADIRGGLARHKDGRWQYAFDGPLVYRLQCY